jgi:hypothetical protein
VEASASMEVYHYWAVTLFGIIKYNQLPNIYGAIGIILIIIGVILVNYLGKVSN